MKSQPNALPDDAAYVVTLPIPAWEIEGNPHWTVFVKRQDAKTVWQSDPLDLDTAAQVEADAREIIRDRFQLKFTLD